VRSKISVLQKLFKVGNLTYIKSHQGCRILLPPVYTMTLEGHFTVIQGHLSQSVKYIEHN